MNRTEQVESWRPIIDKIDPNLSTNAAEQFQNRTLRPILKFQHDLLIAIFKNYLVKRKAKWSEMSSQKRRDYIEHAVRKDLRFRALLIGTVCGLFTVDEWIVYTADEGELRKRLVNMLVERLKGEGDVFDE